MNLKELGQNIGLEEEEFIEMLDLFIESGGADLDRLEAAIKAGNAEKAHEASHSIKGSSGSLMLNEIFDLSKSIDDIVRTGTLEGIDEMVVKLRNDYETLKKEIAESKS